MTDNATPDHQRCIDTEESLLEPEAHDLIEVDQELLLDLDNWAVYETESECRRDGCQGGFLGLKTVGETLKTISDLRTITYEVYEAHYEEPRQTPHLVFLKLSRSGDFDRGIQNAVADKLADAAKLGCLDADADQEKQTEQEVYNEILAEHFVS